MPFSKLNIKDYSYNLPDNRIAHYPLVKREASKLLIYNNGLIKDENFHNIISFLTPESLLIFNKTKVVNASLLFQKETGSSVEIFCLEPVLPVSEISSAFMQKQKVVWKCFIGGAKKWKEGKLSKSFGDTVLTAEKVGSVDDVYLVEFDWNNSELTFGDILQSFGFVPLPPYIKRTTETLDSTRYQTVYAHDDGSVAAPTAGLHFTNELIQQIENDKKLACKTDYITLHVGAGTFKPVAADTPIGKHVMHTEHITVGLGTLAQIKKYLISGGIVAIGTTSLRTLESIYWMGVNIIRKKENPLHITQFQPYDEVTSIASVEAVEAVETYIKSIKSDSINASTSLMIVPGYEFRIVKELITNFHQPNSTLLLLVSAFIGDDWRKVYQHALDHDYRFLSYGDACYFKRLELK